MPLDNNSYGRSCNIQGVSTISNHDEDLQATYVKNFPSALDADCGVAGRAGKVGTWYVKSAWFNHAPHGFLTTPWINMLDINQNRHLSNS